MSEFKPITTQEEFDAAIGERLKRERAATAEKYADYETLKSQNATYAQQLEAANKQSNELSTELASVKEQVKAFETSSMKHRIAHKMGIPYELAGRLTGDDEKSTCRFRMRAFDTLSGRSCENAG